MALRGFESVFQTASQALGLGGGWGGMGGSRSAMNGILGQLGMNDSGGLGNQLAEQVTGETDEQRKKRLRDQQTGSIAPGGGAAFDLFGGMGGLQY